jgi:hypothetical protein
VEELNCKDLDAYLAGSLSGSRGERFRDHLSRCQACQEELAAEEKMDLLLSSLEEHLGAAPEPLVHRIERSLRAAKGRRTVGRLAAVAAALLVGVTIFQFVVSNPHFEHEDGEINRRSGREPVAHVTLKPQSGFLALPVETENQGVTIVFVYPELNVYTAGRTDRKE